VFGPSGPTLSSALRRRFDADRVVLAELLPRLRHYIWATGEGAYAEGIVEVDIGAGYWEEVEIRMDFDSRYPHAAPRVYDHRRRWKPNPDRHIMFDHEFCLWLGYVDTPDVTTVAGFHDFVLRLVLFLRDQFVFDDIGRWPGPEWRHGARAAYAQHLVERLGIEDAQTLDRLWPLLLAGSHRPDRACPCGSRLPYGRCHQRDLESLRWIRGLPERDLLPGAIREHLPNAA
jgi:SEC-C motif